jgi:tryptophan synthase alpha chain
MLEKRIRSERARKEILLMTHLVSGYPSFEENRKLITQMVDAGVEMMELQIPFSEPTSDGPVILKANDEALKRGTTVSACFQFAKEICAIYPDVMFLFMTYYNIMLSRGIAQFVSSAKQFGIQGLIIPDLPPEEGDTYLEMCCQYEIDPIFIFTPTNTLERLQQLAKVSKGFVYCVGRRGVTGMKTTFTDELQERIQLYKSITDLPIALGFGVREKADIDFLKGKVDIAVIGTQILRIQEEHGTTAVGTFLKGLRMLGIEHG